MEPSQIPQWAFDWLKRRLFPSLEILSLAEMMKRRTPDFWFDDIDDAYRHGFEEGFDYAIECFQQMYAKNGFVRTNEIANVLWDWSEKTLRPWRYKGVGAYRTRNDPDFYSHPPFKHESWSKIRTRILRRGKECARCGDVIKLEVDHIIDVQNGGLPIDENLRVLCVVCHKGKKHWDR